MAAADGFGFPSGHAAAAGIVMEAQPKPGDTYLQENYPGHALDAATVLATNASVAVPFGTWIATSFSPRNSQPWNQGRQSTSITWPG